MQLAISHAEAVSRRCPRVRDIVAKILLVFLATLLLEPALDAHPVSQSYWLIEPDAGRIRTRILVSLSDAAKLQEIDRQLPKEPQGGLPVLPPNLRTILLGGFTLQSPMEAPRPRIVHFELLSSGFAELETVYEFHEPPSRLELSSTFHDLLAHPHRTLCRIEANPPHEFVLDHAAPARSLALRPSQTSASWRNSLPAGFAGFFGTVLPVACFLSLLFAPGGPFSRWALAGTFTVGQGLAFLASEWAMLDLPFARTAAALAVCYAALEHLSIPNRQHRVLTPLFLGLLFGLFLSQVGSSPQPGLDVADLSFVTGLSTAPVFILLVFLRMRRQGFLSREGSAPRYLSITCLALGLLFLSGLL